MVDHFFDEINRQKLFRIISEKNELNAANANSTFAARGLGAQNVTDKCTNLCVSRIHTWK
jgi:TPP-dependent 2-oxoacid decarboxylase